MTSLTIVYYYYKTGRFVESVSLFDLRKQMIKSKKNQEYSTTFLKGNSGITYQVSNGSKLIIRYQRPEATKKEAILLTSAPLQPSGNPQLVFPTN